MTNLSLIREFKFLDNDKLVQFTLPNFWVKKNLQKGDVIKLHQRPDGHKSPGFEISIEKTSKGNV